MDKSDVERYIKGFQNKDISSLIDRKLPIFSDRSINVIIGPRRAGKTFMMFQIMKDKIAKGEKKSELAYFNFEDLALNGINFKEIIQLVEMHMQIFNSAKPMLFFDEPQIVQGWEKAVRHLYDHGYNMYLSGSSSKMLSKEIATSLRGRSLSYLVLPFSFIEFLKLRNIAITALLSQEEKTRILGYLDEYLEFGGFPEVLLETDKELKIKKINEYFELVVYKDIVDRYQVKDSMIVKWILKATASAYSKEVSINKIFHTLKSQNRSISNNDVYSYVSMIKDAFFIFFLPRFSRSIKKRELKNKAYLCDLGFTNILGAESDKGRKMENIVFLELFKHLPASEELFFWKSEQMQYEVDFVCKKGESIIQLIQVCYDPKNSETKEREIRALLKAGKELKCKNLTVITYDYESEESAEWFGIKGRIKYVPIWKWLLEK